MTTSATITLQVSLAGSDTPAIIAGLRRLGWLPDGEPDAIEVDHDDAPAGESLDAANARARRKVHASYPYPGLLVVQVGQVVTVAQGGVSIALPALMEQLAELPFEVASFASMHPAWHDGSLGTKYLGSGLGGEHVPLGWAAAFRGRGHDGLVSRRWLETGPWTLWQGAVDVSLLQFHDLDDAPAAALAQARVGHAQLGIGDTSGFLQQPFSHRLELGGLYDPATRMLRVVVLGRELSDRELLEWAAIRAERRDAAHDPVATIAFVFPDPAEAEKNRARLWRYEHQVWAIEDGVSAASMATPPPPARRARRDSRESRRHPGPRHDPASCRSVGAAGTAAASAGFDNLASLARFARWRGSGSYKRRRTASARWCPSRWRKVRRR